METPPTKATESSTGTAKVIPTDSKLASPKEPVSAKSESTTAQPVNSGHATATEPHLEEQRDGKTNLVFDLENPEYYLNRELTWLAFNKRVLNEAEDQRTPLLERVKFLAIVSSNLDEFFMKRIGGLKQQVYSGVQALTIDGRTPQQQIDECETVTADLERQIEAVFSELEPALKEHGIEILEHTALAENEKNWLRQHFIDNIYPLLTPQAVDPAHPFPFISNLSLNLLVSVRYSIKHPSSLARIKVPVGQGTPRFVRLPSDGYKFIALESVIEANLDLLFPKMEIQSCVFFRTIRNANTEQNEESADDLLRMIESELQDRRFAPIVRLTVSDNIEPVQAGMLAAELGLQDSDVRYSHGMKSLRDLMQIASLPIAELHDPPHIPTEHPALWDSWNIFHTIRQRGTILLHHPFESFRHTIERFIKEASRDPKVRAIKMTIYRTSKDTRIIDYLIQAARSGKQVAVVVELKARFDEAENIRWANSLEEAGIHVTYGVVGLKTHCKVIMVVRQDYSGIRRYLHIGTGNYNATTAKLYCDLGVFTCEPEVGQDATELFNYLTTGYSPARAYKKLLPSPKLLKNFLLERIEHAMQCHRIDKPSYIRLKSNALEDADITKALYRCSQAGVKIDLIIRDSCRIRPGIPGLSENISVISVVGRFLEHSRIYQFKTVEEEWLMIGSADLMTRNLNSRVEVMVIIESDQVRREIDAILDTYINDQRGAWDMQADGSYLQRQSPEEGQSAQNFFIEMANLKLKKAQQLKRRKPEGILRNAPHR